MAQELSVSVDLHELLKLGPIVRAQIFQNLAGAVESVAQAGVGRWQMAVKAQKLWSGEKNAYVASIRYEMKGPYAAEIVSDYKFVEDIETGRPAYDLKRMLDTGPRVRRTKDGRRFLVIPIRHNTPGASGGMSKAAYQLARQLLPTTISSQGHRPAGEVTELSPGHGMRAAKAQTDYLSHPKSKSSFLVRKNNYAYGGRLTRKALVEAGASKTEQRHLAGALRFDTSSGKSSGSAYLTFRMMVEGSSGWIIPARPGLWIAKAVSESLQQTAAVDFPAAMQMDLKAAA